MASAIDSEAITPLALDDAILVVPNSKVDTSLDPNRPIPGGVCVVFDR